MLNNFAKCKAPCLVALSLLLAAAPAQPRMIHRANGGQPVQIEANPNPATAGQQVAITVTMNGTVSQDTAVSTSYSFPSPATRGRQPYWSGFPTSVTVPSGQSQATFYATPYGAGSTSTVSASCNGAEVSTSVTIQ